MTTPNLSGREVVQCPVDECDWSFQLPDLPLSIGVVTVIQWADAVESVLAAHADTHRPVEYLKTIHRLNGELAASRAKECHGH